MALMQENLASDFGQRIAGLSLEKRTLLVQRLPPLSYAQQRIWVLEQLQPGSVFYNMCLPVHFLGPLNVGVLEQSLTEVFRRHEALRTVFPIIDGQAVQLVTAAQPLHLPVTNLSHLPVDTKEAETQRLINALTQEPFDLERGPVWRARLVELGPEEHVVVLVVHHLVFDGWSRGVLTREVGLLYNAYLKGEPSPLEELPMQYGAYARWQRQSLSGEMLDEQMRYWREQLGGELPVLELPADHPRPPIRTRRGASASIVFPRSLSDALKGLSRKEGVTLFMTLLAAFQTLLHRYAGQSDIIVGTPISGRQQWETEQLIGFFVNTVVMRTRLDGNLKLRDLLVQDREVVLQAHDHQDLPFEKLVEALQPKRDRSHTPVFQVMFTFMNAPELAIEMPAMALRPLKYESRMAEFDLTLNLSESESGLLGALEYNRDLFEAATIDRMVGHYRTLLESMIADPEQTLGELQLLTVEEQEQLLVEWNNREMDYGPHRCLQQLIEAQVERSPEAVALVYEGQQLTYGELNRRANQLAHYLERQGVGPEVLVGILMERSLELLVGLLGVLKAGGAYVPLDPGYPEERLRRMVTDAGIAVVLTQEQVAGVLAEPGVPVVCFERDWEQIGKESEANPESAVVAENLAYVIHTSGSTGTPKGAMNTHRAIGNRLQWMQQRYQLQATDRVLQKTPLSFDVSVWELFWPLIEGARLVLARPGGHQDPEYLLGLIEREQISTLHFVPSMLQQFLGQSGVARQCQSVRQVMCSGEALSLELQERYFEVLSAPLHNLYGPTEAAVDVTSWECQRGERGTSVPIGEPIANVEVHVLDEQLRLAPVGVVGQLYLGGECVGRGYVRQAGLTAERFIPHPYSRVGGERLYRTGDEGRYRADGNLEYVGRADQQVKLRGYRIELGEIEAVLRQHEAVTEAVVVVQAEAGQEKRLVAYVVSASEVPPTTSELRQFMQQRLPIYMLPSVFVFLETLPLTTSGKLNRKALPAPDHSRPQLEEAMVFAQTPVEERLAAIWCEFLRLEQVGIHDNFFELGGDSILSIQVVARANQEGMHLTPSQLFEYQTIAELAAVVDIVKTPEAEQGLVTGPVPLTPIQHWFFEQHQIDPHHFNQAVLLEVNQKLDPVLLEQTIQHLVSHHDALRLRFVQEQTGWRQFNAGADERVHVMHLDLSSATEQEQMVTVEAEANQQQASFDLRQGPLMRVVLSDLGPEKPALLLLIFHHLVIDGVSWRILFQDLVTIYEQLERREPVVLPAKTTSYKQWADSLMAYAQSESIKQESAFWAADSRQAVKPLPLDHPEGSNDEAAARPVVVSLTAEETRALLKEVPGIYHTQINDVLLAALAQGLAQWTGETSFLVEMEGHGREEIIQGVDLSRTVGWFTSVYPVLLELAETDDSGATLKSIKEQLRAIPQRGIGYGLLRYLSRDKETAEKLRSLPQAEISFNYMGQFEQLPETSSFGPSRWSKGATQGQRQLRRYPLEVKGGVGNGCLQLTVTYCENLHRRETIQGLAANIIEALRALITHCLSPAAGGYTPSDFPLAALDQQTVDWLVSERKEIEDIYPLSPMQQGLLFHSLYAPEASEYFVQLTCTLDGELDSEAFKRVWQEVLDRHPITRTSFVWENLKQPLQIVHSHIALPWQELDWRTVPAEQQPARLEKFLESDHKQGFDLSQAPLLRFSLIRQTENSYQFVWSYHHLLFDGWTLPLLLKEVFTFYEAFHQKQSVSLERSRPYKDYIAWLSRQDMSKAEAYWREKLAGFTTPTQLSIGGVFGPSALQRSSKQVEQLFLPNELTEKLQAFARKQQVTLNTVVQAAWALLLSHYSGEEDVIFGTTVSGRPPELTGVERMLGLFINTLPVRVQLSSHGSLVATLQHLQVEQARMRQFEYTPLVQVQTWSEVPRGRPLFESLLIFQNYQVEAGSPEQTEHRASVEIGGLDVIEQTNYPLTITVVPDWELMLRCSYNAEQYQAGAVRQMLSHFRNLLVGMSAKEEQNVWNVRLLSEAEEAQVLRQGHESSAEYQSSASLTELFERQVERTPEAIAVVYEEQQVSYGELNRRANQLGHYLLRLGVGPESLVALVMERSLEMMVAVLGVLKAGGAYLPVDPAYPGERVRFMLEDANATVVLTSAVWPEIATESETNLESVTAAENLAYVIYTSGSTGKPKGVMVEHRSLLNFLSSMQHQFGFSQDDVLVAVTTLSFDIAGLELFLPLVSGAQLVIAARAETLDAKVLATLMERSGATIMQATPATWRMLVDAGWSAGALKILCGGEALNRELADRLVECGETWNMYGPTETTIWSSTHRVDDGEEAAIVSLGRPIANTGFYVVDERMHLVPMGVSGELLIGGAGVARGYLNRPELTSERFVADPFSSTGGERLYRTGDRVRWDANGRLEYLGRLDHQVKIRGYRIEAGEIEAVLAEHEQIRQAVVMAHADVAGHDQLVGYVVTEEAAPVSTSELRRHLSEKLPEYMIPAIFVPLAELPLTANGKLDRKALPAPDGSRPLLEREFVAPRTTTEKVLAEIWSEVLGVSEVGIHDNFFELGGHSLLATVLSSRIRASFSLELPLRYVFEAPTIARLALAITQGQAAEATNVPAIKRIEEHNELELLAQLDEFSDEQVDSMLRDLATAD